MPGHVLVYGWSLEGFEALDLKRHERATTERSSLKLHASPVQEPREFSFIQS